MTLAERLEQKGKQEGKREGRQEIALKMIQKGADNHFIMECTDLSKEEIEKLRKKKEGS